MDILRATALGGILVINAMSIMAVKGSTPAFTVPIPPVDRALQDFILFAIESKFFTLFSLLFGVSFAIQIGSAQRQAAAFLPRITRRLAALLVFGMAHIVLFWDGDILVIYAITGCLLIFMRKLSSAALRSWIIGLLALPAALVFGIFVWTLVWRLTPSGASALAASDASLVQSFDDTSATQKLLQATFLAGAADRLDTYRDLLPLLLSRIPTVLAMFLLGLLLGRGNFLRELSARTSFLRMVRRRALLCGAVVMALIVASTKTLGPTSALVAIIEDQYIAGPVLCLGYAATLTLLYLKGPNGRLMIWLRPMGQMALTNYLTQSMILTALSYGWGAGLALKLSGFEVLGVCGVVFAVQMVWSRVWLRAFRFGPLEWLWRCATYWRWMPLRRF